MSIASSNGESDLPGATWHWASHGPFAAASLLEAPALGFRFDGFQSLDLGWELMRTFPQSMLKRISPKIKAEFYPRQAM